MGVVGKIRRKKSQIGAFISVVSDMVCPLPSFCINLLKLSLFRSAQQLDLQHQPETEPEKSVNYSFAPETLLQSAYCSCETDIWMLGYMASQANHGPRFFFFFIDKHIICILPFKR